LVCELELEELELVVDPEDERESAAVEATDALYKESLDEGEEEETETDCCEADC
jgi:hypothetical protein